MRESGSMRSTDRQDDLLDRLRERAADLSRCHDMCAPHRPGVRYPCVDKEAIAQAVSDLGFRLPRLLRAVYQSVGNGGFGPGYGLIGLEGGATDDQGLNLVELYQQHEATTFDRLEGRDCWPEK